MNFKKIIALVLVVALTAAVTFGATVAFLTDETEVKHNVFNVGNVDIEITEKVSDTTAEFVTNEDGTEYSLIAPGDKLEKEVVVSNNGNLDAYVAVTVTLNNADKINKAIDNYYEKKGYTPDQIQAVFDAVFEGWGLNYEKKDADGNALGMRLTITGDDMPEYTLQVDSVKTLTDYAQSYTGNWFGSSNEEFKLKGYYTKGMGKYEFKYTYYLLLPAGKSTTLFEGLNVPEEFVNEQMAMFNGLEIDISGAAIQADNMPTAEYAFMVLHGDELPPVVSTTEDLQAAMKTKGNEIILASGTYDMGGKFSVAEGVTIVGGEDVVIKGTLTSTVKNVTFKNVTFKGANPVRWTYASGKVVFENCTFDASSVYAIHYDGTSGAEIVYKNCDIIGWVAITGGQKSLTFDGCTIEGNGSYGVIRVYGDTTIKNCTFDVSNVNTTDEFQDGIHAVDCTVNVINCVNKNGAIEDIFNVSGTGVITKN